MRDSVICLSDKTDCSQQTSEGDRLDLFRWQRIGRGVGRGICRGCGSGRSGVVIRSCLRHAWCWSPGKSKYALIPLLRNRMYSVLGSGSYAIAASILESSGFQSIDFGVYSEKYLLKNSGTISGWTLHFVLESREYAAHDGLVSCRRVTITTSGSSLLCALHCRTDPAIRTAAY